ncbi:Fc.00g088420.m01.CDS01 [Cosmosporella sp. VM-42]
MRRDNKLGGEAHGDETDYRLEAGYFTYRPLSNLPTPPPSSRNSSAAQSPRTTLDDGEPLKANFRGPAIHLVNLIPPSASLATPSVPLVQAILSRANLPLETVALAVCILDSLDSRFARHWRLSCPLLSDYFTSSSKRHTLPPAPLLNQRQQLHIDSVNPELIILSALIIAVKFTEDPQEATQYYCQAWGRGMWSHNQLNVTERCIMENLNYRIMPLCNEDCLTDAMVDMQLAAQQPAWDLREYTPPESTSGDDDEDTYIPTHSRSKTLGSGKATLGLGLALTPVDTPAGDVSQATTPRPTGHSGDYFGSVKA